MLAQALTASLVGVEGVVVRVEVDVSHGLPSLTVVGLPGSAVQEARERVRAAIRNAGFEVPARRITVNLAPADLPKEGTAYDLAIAIGILAASGQLRSMRDDTALFAELALDGRLQPVPGLMALVAAARDAGLTDVVVAEPGRAEAATVRGIRVRPAATIGDAAAHLAGHRELAVSEPTPLPAAAPVPSAPDLADFVGQSVARRALEIAVAGRHSLALCGPPGVGKTLLLRCVPPLVPPLTDGEALEVSRIYSVAGLIDHRSPVIRLRPFRAPHHTISTQALVGGGPRVRPGEASLAHRGLLFLDEALQFRADALDSLRQPLESGTVTIARVDGALELPARFTLLAAFNPCPCGWFGDRSGRCSCDPGAVRRYAARLSGPLRDRLDLFVPMAAAPGHSGFSIDGAEPSVAVAGRVRGAWDRQVDRQGVANAELQPGWLRRGDVPASVLSTLAARGRQLSLSARRVDRVAAVARTIADLAGRSSVEGADVDEAARYRFTAWS